VPPKLVNVELVMSDYILIVDDEQPMIDLLKVMLKMSNYRVEGATSGSEAIALAQIAPPRLILLDLMMPDVSGFDVCQTLRTIPGTENVPIAILTAKHGPDVEEQAHRSGANFLLIKPVTRGQLLELVEKALNTVT
jgi:putative two-component system response regulator